MEAYVAQMEAEEHKEKAKMVQHTRSELGLGLESAQALTADFVSPTLPKRVIICPIDGSPDSWAAFELAMHMALDPSPPGVRKRVKLSVGCAVDASVNNYQPYRLNIASTAYMWDRMPGSKESKKEKADRFAQSLLASAIHKLQEFEKAVGKKLFYGTGTVTVVGDDLDKEVVKA